MLVHHVIRSLPLPRGAMRNLFSLLHTDLLTLADDLVNGGQQAIGRLIELIEHSICIQSPSL